MDEQVFPAFYQRDEQGLPPQLDALMRKALALAPRYSATRMMKEYAEKLY
jgi:starch phosphorylase